MMSAIPTELRAIFFDAGFTLLELRRPFAELYVDEARALVELPLPEFRAHMAQLVPRLNREFRFGDAEHRTSDERERLGWWRFSRAAAEPFPELLARHDEWHERLVERFAMGSAWRVVAGADRLIERCRRAGLTVGVISNWHSAVHHLLRECGLAPGIEFILVSSEFGWRKPSPKIFEHALTRAMVPASQAVHVGDSWEDDVVGAASAGVHPVFFQRSRHASGPANREDFGPVTVVQSLSELADGLELPE
jgi:putative hydrolase of the HAD superfamily